MKINELLYKTPEMTEEKLLELIRNNISFLESSLLTRIEKIHKYAFETEECILKEWDLIQEKKSFLTKNQRDKVCILVSTCLIQMTNGGESTNSNKLESIPEIEEIRDNN